MTGLESGETTRTRKTTDEGSERPEHESSKTRKELNERADSEKTWKELGESLKKWDALAEWLKKREELEAEIRRFGEEFDRKERARRGSEAKVESHSRSVVAGQVTKQSEKAETADEEVRGSVTMETAEKTEDTSRPARETEREALERTRIRLRSDLERAIEHHPEVRLRERFEEDYRNAAERMERGGDGRGKGTAFLNELDRMELHRLYTEAHGGPPDVHLESVHDMQRALQKHSDLELREDDLGTYEKFFEFGKNRSASTAELSERLDLRAAQINYWRAGLEPPLVKELRERETERIIDEWARSTDLSKIAEHDPQKMRLEQRFDAAREIPESVVREAITVETKRSWTVDDLAEMTRRAYLRLPETSARVHYTDLRKSAGLSAEELSELERTVSENHTQFEKTVQEKLGLDGVEAKVRVGLMDDTLYIWKPDLDPRNLINPYGSLYFYFSDRDTLARFVSEVKGNLQGETCGGLHGTTQHLERLISQMFPESTKGPHVGGEHVRIQGDHLHLMLDMAGAPLKSLEGHMSRLTKVSGKGGIDSPKFPEGEDLEVLIARIMSTVTSDCHLRENGTVEYYEDHIERIHIVGKYLTEFGDIRLKPRWHTEDHYYYCCFPTPIGEMLHSLGVTATDKTIENQGLPPILYKFCERALRAYVEDLLPQDGSVSNGRITWSHSNALHPGNKGARYEIEPLVGEKEIELIKKYGDREEHDWVMSRGKLIELMDSDSDETRVTASHLSDVINQNPCRLVRDEQKVAELIGIESDAKPYRMWYQTRTGKVTVAWTAYPTSACEIAKLGMIAPPNDVEKRESVRSILRRNDRHVKRALKELEERGIQIERWWD